MHLIKIVTSQLISIITRQRPKSFISQKSLGRFVSPSSSAVANYSSSVPVSQDSVQGGQLDENKGQVGHRDSSIEIGEDLIHHLERTSLVDFGNEEAVQRLKEAIQFSEILFEVDTSQVEPMDSVLENIPLRLREDELVKEENSREKILRNASITEEDYFVAPPGNIPLHQKNKDIS